MTHPKLDFDSEPLFYNSNQVTKVNAEVLHRLLLDVKEVTTASPKKAERMFYIKYLMDGHPTRLNYMT